MARSSQSHPAVTLNLEGSAEFVASLDAPIATGADFHALEEPGSVGPSRAGVH